MGVLYLRMTMEHLQAHHLMPPLSVRTVVGLGGERGIRTPETLSGLSVFKTDAIDRSAISPQLVFQLAAEMVRHLCGQQVTAGEWQMSLGAAQPTGA